MTDVGPLYREGRGRIGELVRDLSDDEVASVVPGCPEWTVKDVVAHLSGICADIINGNLDGVATDAWTAAQVNARRDWTLAKILDEWAEYAPQCEAIAQHFPEGAAVQWLADLTTHEHDLRGALDQPGERDSQALRLAFEWLAKGFGKTLDARELPPIRFESAEGEHVVAGGGAASTVLSGSRFELFRLLTGRRSTDQIFAFAWHGDAERYKPAFVEWGPFRPAATAVIE